MNAENIIEQSRNNLLLTGELNDFQLKNLKSWPAVLFDNLDKTKIKFDFTLDEDSEQENALGIHAGTVEFDFYFSKGVKTSKELKQQKLGNLTMWVKFMFWSDTKVVFKRKGKLWT